MRIIYFCDGNPSFFIFYEKQMTTVDYIEPSVSRCTYRENYNFFIVEKIVNIKIAYSMPIRPSEAQKSYLQLAGVAVYRLPLLQ
jgi:hypothetical protein